MEEVTKITKLKKKQIVVIAKDFLTIQRREQRRRRNFGLKKDHLKQEKGDGGKKF